MQSKVFERPSEEKNAEELEKERLYQAIGQHKTELGFLKHVLGK